MTCARTLSLGAYLLGALDPAERSAFEAHVSGCDACRGELVRLSPVPGLLHRIRVEDFEDSEDAAVGPQGFAEPRFDDEPDWADWDWTEDSRAEEASAGKNSAGKNSAGKNSAEDTGPIPRQPASPPVPNHLDRPRRGRRYALVGAVALALSVGTVFLYEDAHRQVTPAAVMVSWTATDPASGVRADVDLTDRAWGTEVKIRLHDVPAGKPCKLVVRGRDGYREVAGWWATSYVQGESIPGSTSIDLTRISRVEVVTDDDVVLVDVPAPS
ncbi:zf-HC2 domain-containing protein [Actinokineospora sp. NBRC 105648]|uniref:anti-sigma factor family protein n=1 Tax=Actinokineospora sp. NBRC 105648 TaxID=3032206 RepID=UPI0024A1469F|nr:zf-HC2 domain-containing protein [Actinokineospora sp. NBRC 105648]GLZ42991.1 hypothetical protein Acsp05_66150 [Actinokineospora sp. NBRC 105648]